MSNKFKGSEWAKWDLHVHTPDSITHEYKCSKDRDIWEEYISNLEKLPAEFKVLGINDYLTVDGYKKINEYKSKGRLQNIECILPVVEFRIDSTVSSGAQLNMHILFSDEVPGSLIDNFLKDVAKTVDSFRHLGCDFNVIDYNKDTFKKVGDSIRSNNLNPASYSGLSSEQIFMKDYLPTKESIINGLKEKFDGNSDYEGKYIIILGKKELDDFIIDGVKPTNIKKDIVDKCKFCFIASPTLTHAKKNNNYMLETYDRLVFHSSDAHKFMSETNNASKNIGHCYTWVKSVPSFEGLRQALIERDRILISDTKPADPIHMITSLHIENNEDIIINGLPFCFSYKDKEIQFSPNLTCIIGGRGTGKSTLLELLSHATGHNDQIITKDSILDRIKPEDINVFINGDKEVTLSNFEYISQNSINEYAQDYNRLTKSIVDRIYKRGNKEEFDEKILQNNYNIGLFQNRIKLIEDKMRLNLEINDLVKQKREKDNINNAFNDEDVRKLSIELNDIAIKYNKYKGFKDKYFALKQVIDNLSMGQGIIVDGDDSLYKTKYNNIIIEIDTLKKNIFLSKEETNKEDSIIAGMIAAYNEKKQEYENKLREKYNLSSENLADISSLPQDIMSLEQAIKIKSENLETIKNDLLLSETKISNINSGFSNYVHSKLEDLKYNFKGNESKKISFNITYNEDLFNENFIAWISNWISNNQKKVLETILCNDRKNILSPKDKSKEDYIAELQGKSSGQTIETLLNVLANEEYFEIFKAKYNELRCDENQYMMIDILYDNKKLKDLSFGQRSTAIILVLLILGNSTLVIDEPEAHLDQEMISDELIRVIKEVKKQRQIIFATHNANIVINGDADLIYVLEINQKTKKTDIISTTIEDVKNRDKLLRLEGGDLAFKKRDERYNIKNKVA